MRWYVDINSIGSNAATKRYCIDAEQWQKALQSVRTLRADDAPFGNFSIELLEDGYRAIDPLTRTRYVVHRAPDDAAVTGADAQVITVEAKGSGKIPAARASRPRPSQRGRGRQPSIPDDPVPRTKSVPPAAAAAAGAASTQAEIRTEPVRVPPPAPSSQEPSPPTRPATPATIAAKTERDIPAMPDSMPMAAPPPVEAAAPRANGNGAVAPAPQPVAAPVPVPPVVGPRGMQAETAFERMTGGIAVPLPSAVSPTADVPTDVLPPFKILSKRVEDPTPSSPLTYRELAFAVDPTTTLRDAEAIARAQFEVLRNSLSGAPKGKYIQLAVFDHEFSGRPKKMPVVTLSFKDWRDQEPDLRFPQRDGAGPPRSVVPPPVAGGPASAPRPAVREEVSAEPPEPESEPIRPAPVISITDEPLASLPSMTAHSVISNQAPTILTAPPNLSQTGEGEYLKEGDIESAIDEPPPPPPPSSRRAPPSSVRIPAPSPSEIRRSAADMAGDDERTVVKPSTPPPGPEPEVYAEPPPPEPPPPEPPTESASMVAALPPPPPAPAPAEPVARVPSVPPPPPPQGTAQLGAAALPLPPPRFASTPPPPQITNEAAAQPASSPPQSMRQPVASAPPQVVSARPGAPAVSKPPPGGLMLKAGHANRKAGEDLLTDLFEATSDLNFLRDALEGAEFVLDLVFDSIPSLVMTVSFFDINAREFVVVRQAMVATEGEPLPSILLARVSERSEVIAATMRSRRTTLLHTPQTEALAVDPRWQTLDVVPSSYLCAPVISGGRFLGLIEAANPLDGAPFTEGDGHALTYIGEQFAEFLAQREVQLAPEQVLKPKLAQLARR